MTDLHFGVIIPQIKRSWEEAKTAAIEFESLGYDSLWVCDHLYGPSSPQTPILEAWSELAAVAAVTTNVEIGTLVTPAGMRNPAHLGKIIATVDNIAGGRVIAGLGAGWMEREFTDFGTPYPPTRDRLVQLRETVQLLKRMWSEPDVTFQGKFVNVHNLVCEPKPVRSVPILIGGGGEAVTLRIVAEHADIWNNAAGLQDKLPEKVAKLREHCGAVGRDPNEITISQQCLVTIASSDEAARPMIEAVPRLFGDHMGDATGPLAIAGSPERVKHQIEKHIDLGCRMFLMEFFGRDTREPARLFAEEVLPHFK